MGMWSTQGYFESLLEKPDRRAHARSHSPGLAYMEMGGENGGIALNISEGGLAVTVAEILMADYFPSIRFQLPKSDGWIEASGKVAWVSVSKKGAGIQFVDLTDGNREKIREWVATKDSAGGEIKGTSEIVDERDKDFSGIRGATKLPKTIRKLEVLSEADEARFAVMFPSEESLTNARERGRLAPDIEPRIAEQNSRNVLRFSGQTSEHGGGTGASAIIVRADDELTQPDMAAALSHDIHYAEDETLWPADFPKENPFPATCIDESCEGEQQRASESELAQRKSAKLELSHNNSAKHESLQPDSSREENPLHATQADGSFETEERAASREEQELPAYMSLEEADLMQQLELHRKNQAAMLLREEVPEISPEHRSGWFLLAGAIVCFVVGIAVGDRFFNRLPGHDEQLQQRSGASVASSRAATPAEKDSGASNIVSENAQKSTDASSSNSTDTPLTNSADTATSNSLDDGNSSSQTRGAHGGAPTATPGEPAADTKNGDAKNSLAEDTQQQANGSAPANTSSRNSAADVSRNGSGNSSNNLLSSDVPTSGLASKPREKPEISTHQDSGTPLTSVTKPRQTEASASSPAEAATTQTVEPFSKIQGPILVTAPDQKNGPFRLTLAEQAVSASPTLAVSAQRSVLVPAQPGPASGHRPERLQVGVLIYHVDPQVPAAGDQKEMAGTVKVRATVGKGGDVADVKPISGPMPLIPAVVQAVREWRYTVTLLDGQPLGTEEDVVVKFRPKG